MRSLSDPMQRIGDHIGQLAVALFFGIMRAIVGLLLGCLLFVLRLTKPFVLYPLILAMIGGVGVAITFGLQHKWTDAAEAFGLGLAAWIVTTAYAAFARRLDSTFFDRSPLPPWWWYL